MSRLLKNLIDDIKIAVTDDAAALGRRVTDVARDPMSAEFHQPVNVRRAKARANAAKRVAKIVDVALISAFIATVSGGIAAMALLAKKLSDDRGEIDQALRDIYGTGRLVVVDVDGNIRGVSREDIPADAIIYVK